MKRFIFSIILCVIAFFAIAHANNLKIDTCWVVERNVSQHYYTIGLKLSWENSWRDSVNYDAAWLFLKYRKTSGADTFFHAILDTLDASHQVWSTTPMTIDASFSRDNWGTGIMVFRTDTSGSNISCDSIHLRWYYNRGESMSDADSVTGLRAFGIEMVYIPEGKFFIGDGNSHFQSGGFYRYNRINSPPHYIISEDSIFFGPVDGQPYANYGYGLDSISTGYLSAQFPKGYSHFYLMRYCVSQRQYCHFLNMIDSSAALSYYPSFNISNRQYVRHLDNVFGCDANNNAGFDEPNDGNCVPVIFLSNTAISAYLDWAGLRPITELEYEKACRGPKYPITGEQACGSAIMGSLIYADTDSERVVPSEANAAMTIYRCGGAADSIDDRQGSNASFYGVMDMTLNAPNPCISINFFSFNGNHGDGSTATPVTWPTYYGKGAPCPPLNGNRPVSQRYGGGGMLSIRGARTP